MARRNTVACIGSEAKASAAFLVVAERRTHSHAQACSRCVACGQQETTVHPTNRAERRHHRNRVIAIHRRKHLIRSRSYFERIQHCGEPVWGHYAKWNMNCGATMCHAAKYFKNKAKRRSARQSAFSPQEGRVADR